MAHHVVLLAHVGDAPAARLAVAEGLELAAACPDERFGQFFEGMLAVADLQDGRLEEAELGLTELRRHPERTDFAARAAISYLADCAVARGDGAAALDRYLSALEDTLADEDVTSALLQLAGITASLSLLGRDSEAARLGTVTERLGRERGVLVRRYGLERALRELDDLERRVGPDEWARQQTATAGLTLDELVAEARAAARRFA
jgi:hypothetical protein